MAIPAEKPATKSKEAAEKDAREAERELFERAGYPPLAEDEKELTDGERMVAATEYKHLDTHAMLVKNTGWTKQVTGSSMVHTRQLNAIRSVQAAHSKLLRDVMDGLKTIQRQMDSLERQGFFSAEDSLNPDMNPLLGKSRTRRFPASLLNELLLLTAGEIPFNEQERVVRFFDDVPRIVALERYILRKVEFSSKGFVLAMVRELCTNEYRVEYAYPVDQYYEQLVYIPERLKRFIVATAQRAADKAKAYLPVKEIDKQAKIAFQPSQVAKEVDKSQMHLTPTKRKKLAEKMDPTGTTSEEDDGDAEEAGEPEAKKPKKQAQTKGSSKGKKGKKSEPKK